MRISLFSQSLFALPLAEVPGAVVEAGYGAVELACTEPHLDVGTAKAEGDAWAARLRDSGVTVSALSLFSRFTDAAEADGQVEEALAFLDLAPAFETDVVKITPGPPASADAAEAHWAELVNALERLLPRAGQLGVRLAVETHMRQLTDTACSSRQLLGRVPSRALGLTVDFSNLAFAGDDPAASLRGFGDRVYNTHVKNGHIEADGAWAFTALDDGLTSYTAVLGALREAGYDGYLTLECLQPEARERPVETARRDRLILEQYLAALGIPIEPSSFC